MPSCPPGPAPFPLVDWRLHLLRFYHDPIAYLRAVRHRYGDIAGLTSGNAAFIFAFGPAHNERLLRDTALFHRVGFTVPGPSGSALARLSFGLVSMNGELHKQQRRLLMPAFQKKRLTAYHHDVAALTDRMLDSWRIGEQRDVWIEMRRLTWRIVGATMCGLDANASDRVGAVLDRWLRMNCLSPLLLWPLDRPGTPYRRLLRESERVEQVILRIVEQRRAQPEARDDALGLLLRAHDEGQMTQDVLVGQIATLFVAAYEAAYNALTWIPFLLSQHPAIYSDLHDEVNGLLRGATPSVEQLDALPLLGRVVKESLRILPPVVYGVRQSSGPFELGGYQFAAETNVWFSHYLTHMQPDLYAQPRRFMPDRWLDSSPKPYEYMPFGAGPRACLGALFAQMMLKTVVALLVQRYRLALAPGVRIDRDLNIVLAPRHGMPMIVGTHDSPVRGGPVRGNIREMVALA